jgi:hypothetical protein
MGKLGLPSKKAPKREGFPFIAQETHSILVAAALIEATRFPAGMRTKDNAMTVVLKKHYCVSVDWSTAEPPSRWESCEESPHQKPNKILYLIAPCTPKT